MDMVKVEQNLQKFTIEDSWREFRMLSLVRLTIYVRNESEKIRAL